MPSIEKSGMPPAIHHSQHWHRPAIHARPFMSVSTPMPSLMMLLTQLLAQVQALQPNQVPNKPSHSKPTADQLQRGATETHKMANASMSSRNPYPNHADIPRAYWDQSIAALSPQRVYLHNNNLAVQLKSRADGSSEGLYIPLMHSSYRPQVGDTTSDGLSFNASDYDGILAYSRASGSQSTPKQISELKAGALNTWQHAPRQPAGNDIANTYWDAALTQFNPQRVYMAHNNLVVEQGSLGDGSTYGLYIGLPHSSYAPVLGDNETGFSFKKAWGEGVWSYTYNKQS